MILVNYFTDFSKSGVKEDISIFLGKNREGAFKEMVLQVRNLIEEGKTEEAQEVKKKLPAVTVTALYEGGRRDANMTCFQPIVILDYDKLLKETMDEIIAKINADKHTFASFVSPSGCGVKVFVLTQPSEGEVPQSTAKAKTYHKQAFRQVADYYGELTGVQVDESGKDMGRLLFVSYDPNLYHNPDSEPVVVKPIVPGPKAKKLPIERTFDAAYRNIANTMTYEGGHRNTFVYYLANLLNRKGMVREATTQFFLKKFIDLDAKELISAIDSAYSHVEDHGVLIAQSKGDIVEEMQKFILEHYDVRFNVVADVIEVREKGKNLPFAHIADRVESTIWRQLHLSGISAKIGDLRLLIKSDFAPDYNPFDDYFNHLPQWDGKDYIAQLATTIVVDQDHDYWVFCLRKWMVAMVASLLDEEVANHTVLLFIGDQGLGKSKWCKNLFPSVLRAYYTLIDLSEKHTDFLLKLVQFAVANIDEIGLLSVKDMLRFNKYISQEVIDERTVYATNKQRYVRRASIMASTNFEQVLTDPSGNRRFPTFKVLDVEYQFTINYEQLYAQIKHLIDSGFQFWFNKEEIKQLNRHNERFLFLSPEEEFLLAYFTKEKIHNEPEYLTVSEIMKRISHRTGLSIGSMDASLLGKVMKKREFELKRTGRGRFYKIYEIGDAEVSLRHKNPNIEGVVEEKQLPF